MPKSDINNAESGGMKMTRKRKQYGSLAKKSKFSRKVSRKMLQLADEKIRQIAEKRGVKFK